MRGMHLSLYSTLLYKWEKNCVQNRPFRHCGQGKTSIPVAVPIFWPTCSCMSLMCVRVRHRRVLAVGYLWYSSSSSRLNRSEGWGGWSNEPYLTDVRSWVHLRARTVQVSQQRRGALMHRSASAVFVLGRDTNISINWS